MSSPTQRTLKYLRDQGCEVANVEKWIPQAKVRKDAFGFIDILAITPDRLAYHCSELIGVQTCAAASHAARRDKILDNPNHRAWLHTGNRIQIISWRKAGPRGKRKTWQPRVEEITL